MPCTTDLTLPPQVRRRRRSRTIASSPPACPPRPPAGAGSGATLREKAQCLVGLLDRRIVGRRYFPRLSAGLHDKPAVDELVRCVSDHLRITNIWLGEGELNFPEAYGEELEVLGPLKVGRGYRFSFSYSVTDIEILADLTV